MGAAQGSKNYRLLTPEKCTRDARPRTDNREKDKKGSKKERCRVGMRAEDNVTRAPCSVVAAVRG